MGRGPRRGAVAHVRPKGPFGYNGAPQIRHQKYPSQWTDPQTPLPASSLDPSDLRCQTASGSNPSFFHNALDRSTDQPTHVCTCGPTDRPTDRPRESLMTIDRCASRATRPNNVLPSLQLVCHLLQFLITKKIQIKSKSNRMFQIKPTNQQTRDRFNQDFD